MKTVIFSIDKWSDTNELSKFLRLVDGWKATGKVGMFKMYIGRYLGDYEVSFQMKHSDFVENYGVLSSFVEDQECFMIVEDDGLAYFERCGDKSRTFVGNYEKAHTKEDAERLDGWTYDPQDKSFYIIN